MKIDAKQLEKDIEAIPGVCVDAKKAIKKLFENNFEVKFKDLRKPKVGEVWKIHEEIQWIIEINSKKYVVSLKGVRKGCDVDGGWLNMWGGTLIAGSLKEYFENFKS